MGGSEIKVACPDLASQRRHGEFRLTSADDIGDEVGFHNQDTIATLTEFHVPWHTSQMRLLFESTDSVIQAIDKSRRPTRSVLRNPLEDRKQILLCSVVLPGIHSSAKCGHHLPMRDPLLARCGLSLSDTEFFEELDPGFEAFVVIDRLDDEVWAITGCRLS